MAGRSVTKTKTISSRSKPEEKETITDEHDVIRDLRLLRAILEPASGSGTITGKAERPKSTVSAPTIKTTTSSRTGKNGAEKEVKTDLSLHEQKKLAMNSFNQNLKTLSALTKQRTTRQPQRHNDSQPRSTTNLRLHEIKETETSFNPSSKTFAECACAALGVLRLDEVEDGTTDEFRHKREQGAILLLDNLISLESKELAHIEATKIYEQHWKRRKSDTKPAYRKIYTCKTELRALLQRDEACTSKKAFNLTCSFQSQVLRLAILYGIEALSSGFLEALQLDVNGSPGSVVLTGHQRGFIGACEAGANLKVIAQALARFSSIARTKSGSVDKVCSSLNLLVEAQMYKLACSKILKEESQSSTESWSALEQAVRHISHSNCEKSQTFYNQIKTILGRLQSALQSHGHETRMPIKLSELLIELAERHDDPEHMVVLLTDLSTYGSRDERLFYLCRLLLIHLDGQCDQTQLLVTIQDVTRMLPDFVHTPSSLRPNRLLNMVQLRKACLRKLVAGTGSEQEPSSDADIGSKCLELLFFILRFFEAGLLARPDANDKTGRSICLAILKTIEALVDVEAYARSGRDQIFPGYLDYLSQCVELLRELSKKEETKDAIQIDAARSLYVKISNIFWRAHMHPYIAQKDDGAILDMISKSIACLKGLPIEDLSKNALGPRLEKFADLQMKSGRIEESRRTLKQALDHYITSEALSDAAETALSKSNRTVWSDTASLAAQLGRTLRNYNASWQQDQSADDLDHYFYEPTDLPDFHHAVLLEHQLLLLLRKKQRPLRYQSLFGKLQIVLGLTASTKYYVWRLRLVSAFSFRASKMMDLTDDDKSALKEVLSAVLSSKSDGENIFLQSYLAVLQLLVELQICSLAEADRIYPDVSAVEDVRIQVCGCTTLDVLDEVVDDCETLYVNLRAFTNRTLAFGDYETTKAALQIQVHILTLNVQQSPEQLAECHMQLAHCHIQLAELDLADRNLYATEKILVHDGGNERNSIRFYLARAELELAMRDSVKCKHHLAQAAECFARQYSKDAPRSSREQIERDSLIAAGALLASRVAFREASTEVAHRYARQAAKIGISIWTALQYKRSSYPSSKDGSSVLPLTQDLSVLNIGSKRNNDNDGSAFWPYMQLYMCTLRHAASLVSHAGLFEDALYYYNQLSQLQSVQPSLQPDFSTTLSILYARAGQTSAARELLLASEELSSGGKTPEKSDLKLDYVEGFLLLGDKDRAFEVMTTVNAVVCASELSSSRKKTQKNLQTARARRGHMKTASIKVPAKGLKTVSEGNSIDISEVPSSASMTGPLNIAQALSEDRRRSLRWELSAQDSTKQLDGTDRISVPDLCSSPQYLVLEIFAVAKFTLREAWRRLCADSMQSVLTDSAVALPSKALPGRRNRVSLLRGGGEDVVLSPTRNPMSSTCSPTAEGPDSIAQMLHVALRLCIVLLTERKSHCPTDMIHTLIKMEARTSLLLATMGLPFVESSSELVLRTSQPKDEALDREVMLAAAEAATRERASLLKWPIDLISSNLNRAAIDIHQIDKLPSSWSIISLTLAEDEDELLVSKIIKGQSPFLVRIPLHRSNEGDGVDDFVFADAKAEMRNIIKTANESSHDPRGMSDKTARAQWHADREALDERLRLLLQNIELIWLGGFRGILDPYTATEQETMRFSKALSQTLGNHLPSRQKTASDSERVQIHDHVLRIFLGLGDPDTADLDDAIIDLLYFVVDILQFNGEKNAYDEIDWDAMLVDILDALRAYHETRPSLPARHTILILDKELECIPWEALPCLIDQSVSRMPSLATLFERVDQIRLHSETADALPISKGLARGSYILNPSGDLTSTQSVFEPILASHTATPNFERCINTAPTEAQFEKFLTTSDILLYFGHGSGAQYIRARTVRALPRCAVTFLFGCSSAKMTEHGRLESSGMPRAYMLGHAPAVVGCLWDVTDREIDRVALKALSEWGLIDRNDERVLEGLKKKGRKGRVKEKQQKDASTRPKTLTEAVTEGRGACMLRYLCGAAVVVYGVPVVLE